MNCNPYIELKNLIQLYHFISLIRVYFLELEIELQDTSWTKLISKK